MQLLEYVKNHEVFNITPATHVSVRSLASSGQEVQPKFQLFATGLSTAMITMLYRKLLQPVIHVVFDDE